MENKFLKEIVRYRHNVLDISSLSAFTGVRGSVNKNVRDVYFVRALAADGRGINGVEEMDAALRSAMAEGKLLYKRVESLPPLAGREEVDYYSACYAKWKGDPRGGLETKVSVEDPGSALALGAACSRVLEVYRGGRPDLNDSMEKNFVVKMLYWFDVVMGDGFLGKWDVGRVIKIVADDVTKEQEYLFFYLLTLTGADVLLLQHKGDLAGRDGLKGLSAAFVPAPTTRAEKAPKVKRPVQTAARHVENKTPIRRMEKDFEELALCAASVVMIEVHSRTGETVGAGSGIMVGKDGYILTNDHVANGGSFYSVRIENDSQIYETDEVIKYNPTLDLAVIRIGRTLKPLPVYKGEQPLVRGQKVVAIGSPLGLFNSVSDGIIAGFRRIKDVDMIQFTAPISHGSSGGAVLNMYGEVIGISTAGMDGGQNLNLAVGYEWIGRFIRGFV